MPDPAELYGELSRIAGELAELEDRALICCVERDIVIRKLLRLGEPERRVGAAALISGSGVHRIKKKGWNGPKRALSAAS